MIEHHAHIFLGGKNVALYHFGRSHTNGDLVVLFPADRVLAAGDMYTKGDDVPELIDYSGGGSAVEWPSTLRSALQLDFDTVVPGHGPMATKQEMAAYRESTMRLVARVREMNRAKKSEGRHREDAEDGVSLGGSASGARLEWSDRRSAVREIRIQNSELIRMRLAVLLLVSLAVRSDAGRPLQLEDYYRIETASAPAISPDGRWVVFVRTNIIEAENRRHTEIWMSPSDGSAPASETHQRRLERVRSSLESGRKAAGVSLGPQSARRRTATSGSCIWIPPT